MRQQVHDGGQDSQPLAPTRLPVTGAEVQADTEWFNRIDTLIQQVDDGLCDNEWNISLESVPQALALMSTCISTQRQVHPNHRIADLHREDGYVVGPLVERSAAGQVETGVVPMAGQNALFDGSTVQREAHVWAPVV